MISGTIKLLVAFGAVLALASCATEVPPDGAAPAGPELAAVMAAPTAPPAAPTGLTAAAGDGSISLRWDNPGDAGIVSYEVRLRAQDEAEWRRWRAVIDSTRATTSHTLPNLTAGLPYRIQVRARNTVGAGPGTETSATPLPLAPPAAPAGLTAMGGDLSIALSWDDPGDSSISGYEVRSRPARELAWPNWQPIAGSMHTTTSYTLLRGLTNGVLYQVQVRARSAAGAGAPSGVSATPAPAAPTGGPPAAPAGLAAQAGDGSVSLGWHDPGNSGITGYEYRVRSANDADWRSWRLINYSTYLTTSHVLTLTNDLPYQIQIRAQSSAGASEPSEVSATPRAPGSAGK